MKGGPALRWIIAIAVGGVTALLGVVLLGAAVLYGAGCRVEQSASLPKNCEVAVQLIPLAFILFWVAVSVFLIRVLK